MRAKGSVSDFKKLYKKKHQRVGDAKCLTDVSVMCIQERAKRTYGVHTGLLLPDASTHCTKC